MVHIRFMKTVEKNEPDEILHCTIVDIFILNETIDFSKSYELANCLLVVLWINDLPFNSIQ